MNVAPKFGPAFALENADAKDLDQLKRQAEHCTRCDLYKNATQLVFGEGPVTADIVLVGEQPGDKEDLAGKPFVGPAGRLLDRCLDEAGVDRPAVTSPMPSSISSSSRAASGACIPSPMPEKSSDAPGGSAQNSISCSRNLSSHWAPRRSIRCSVPK